MEISHIRRKSKQHGQGMTEYIIIVALIAVSAIAVYASFGKTIRQQTTGLMHEMSGTDSGNDIKAAQDALPSGRPTPTKTRVWARTAAKANSTRAATAINPPPRTFYYD
jgi:Flp pilus assembly pilin Flp